MHAQVGGDPGGLRDVAQSRVDDVALERHAGAHPDGEREPAQRGFARRAAAGGVVHDGAALDFAQAADAIGVDEAMTALGVVKAVKIAFFGGQAVQELQVRVAGLHAIRPSQMIPGGVLLVVGDAQALQDVRHDLGRRQILIDAPAGTAGRADERRRHHGPVTCTPTAGIGPFAFGHDAMDMPYGLPAAPDREQRGLVQQRAGIRGSVKAGKLHAQPVGLGQGLLERERIDLERPAVLGHESEAQVS